MPPSGSLKNHPEAANIALACELGRSSRDIAAEFGTSKSAVDRYRKSPDLSSAAAAAAVAEPVEAVPVEPVILGNPRDVQLDVQRRLLLQFGICEAKKDSRGCALLSVQIRLNAAWLRADAVKNEPENEPGVHVTWNFPPPRTNAFTAPEPEVAEPATVTETTVEAAVPEVVVVAPEVDDEQLRRAAFEILDRQHVKVVPEPPSALIVPNAPKAWKF